MEMTATYSPEDNKLRLYPSARLDKDTYERVRAAGFRWAPKQELFVAPRWTPSREDLCIELAGEIGDEDTSLTDRAEDRADRFENYREKRAADADRAYATAQEIMGGIPLGQPILVGHHSERHARRDAEKIDRAVGKAVSMWRTSEYWQWRARGVKAHADYKHRPEVIARRIKKLESERRGIVRTYTPAKGTPRVMQAPFYCPTCRKCMCKDHPEASEKVPHVYCGAGRGGSWVVESRLPAIKAGSVRWLEHYDRRIEYERALLDEKGASHLLDKPKRKAQPPILNYRAPSGKIDTKNRYRHGDISTLAQVEMLKADYAKINADYKGTSLSADGSHRVRIAMHRDSSGLNLRAVFLADSKSHPMPDPIDPSPEPPAERPSVRGVRLTHQADDPRAAKFKALSGVKVEAVSAPSLFPTPPELAARVIDEAGIESLHRVLEPSAGTGNLVDEILRRGACEVVAIEANPTVGQALRARFTETDPRLSVCVRDFMTVNGELGRFDRIVMNPPFERGQDAQHVRHAFEKLNEGGRLVSIMSPGPFFRADSASVAFREWFDEVGGVVEDLPEGSFKASGTNVATRLVIIDR